MSYLLQRIGNGTSGRAIAGLQILGDHVTFPVGGCLNFGHRYSQETQQVVCATRVRIPHFEKDLLSLSLQIDVKVYTVWIWSFIRANDN